MNLTALKTITDVSSVHCNRYLRRKSDKYNSELQGVVNWSAINIFSRWIQFSAHHSASTLVYFTQYNAVFDALYVTSVTDTRRLPFGRRLWLTRDVNWELNREFCSVSNWLNYRLHNSNHRSCSPARLNYNQKGVKAWNHRKGRRQKLDFLSAKLQLVWESEPWGVQHSVTMTLKCDKH